MGEWLMVDPAVRAGHLTPGLRNSTDCPARRVIEWHEARTKTYSRYPPFPEAIGSLGYLFADAFVKWLVKPTTKRGKYRTEYPVPWYGGVTHLDLVVYDEDSPWYGVNEIKTVGDKKPRAKDDNRRQVCRQWALAKAANRWIVDMPWRIVVIAKSTGLVEVEPQTLNDLAVEDTVAELARVAELYEFTKNHGYLPDGDLVDLCRCAQCYPPTRESLTRHVEPLAHTFDLLKREKSVMDDEFGEVKQDLKDSLPGPGRYETDDWNITMRSNGALLVTKRKKRA